MSDSDRDLVLSAVKPYLARRGIRLFLFGSRARADAGPRSDLDLALHGSGPLPGDLLSDIREALEESLLPFRADVVDYATACVELRRAIDAEGVEWTV